MVRFRVLRRGILPNATGGNRNVSVGSIVEGEYYRQFVEMGMLAEVIQPSPDDATLLMSSSYSEEVSEQESDASPDEDEDEYEDEEEEVSSDFDGMTKEELISLCKEVGIEASNRLKKSEIVELLEQAYMEELDS